MIFPNSSPSGMTALLAAHGVEVKGTVDFTSVHCSSFLRWKHDGKRHSAYLVVACGHPYLSADGHPIPITTDELLAFGLVQEK